VGAQSGHRSEAVRTTPLLDRYVAGSATARPLSAARVADRADVGQEQDELWEYQSLRKSLHGVEATVGGREPAVELTGTYLQYFAEAPCENFRDDSYFRITTGLPAERRDTIASTAGPKAGALVFSAAAWALCVEYAHDLQRPPVDARLKGTLGLQDQLVEKCRPFACHLRLSHFGS